MARPALPPCRDPHRLAGALGALLYVGCRPTCPSTQVAGGCGDRSGQDRRCDGQSRSGSDAFSSNAKSSEQPNADVDSLLQCSRRCNQLISGCIGWCDCTAGQLLHQSTEDILCCVGITTACERPGEGHCQTARRPKLRAAARSSIGVNTFTVSGFLGPRGLSCSACRKATFSSRPCTHPTCRHLLLSALLQPARAGQSCRPSLAHQPLPRLLS